MGFMNMEYGLQNEGMGIEKWEGGESKEKREMNANPGTIGPKMSCSCVI